MQAVGQAVGGFDMPPNDAQMFAPYQAQEQSMGGLNMPPNNPPFVGAHSVAAMQDLINFDVSHTYVTLFTTRVLIASPGCRWRQHDI